MPTIKSLPRDPRSFVIYMLVCLILTFGGYAVVGLAVSASKVSLPNMPVLSAWSDSGGYSSEAREAYRLAKEAIREQLPPEVRESAEFPELGSEGVECLCNEDTGFYIRSKEVALTWVAFVSNDGRSIRVAYDTQTAKD